MSNGTELATKQDIADLRAQLEAKLDVSTFETRMSEFEVRFETRLAAFEKKLMLELGSAVNIIIEQLGARIGVVIDRFDGPIREVRADLDAHRKDFSMHKRPAARLPKRAARRKPAR